MQLMFVNLVKCQSIHYFFFEGKFLEYSLYPQTLSMSRGEMFFPNTCRGDHIPGLLESEWTES